MTITLTKKQIIEIVILVIGIIALVMVVMPRQKGSDVWLPPGVTREDFERSLKEDRARGGETWEELKEQSDRIRIGQGQAF